MPTRYLSILFATFLVTGCASAWIGDPSPQVRNTIHDLQLEGFACVPKLSKIVCTQIEPLRSNQPAICSSERGCIEQPDHLLYNVYEIGQDATGVPIINHDIVRRADKRFKPIVGDS